MSEESSETFGEKLLGLQGFNAECARRYRAEMEQLLVHRIARHERWGLAVFGALIGVMLIVAGVTMASSKWWHPSYAAFDAPRWTVAGACALSGVLLGGWLLRVAIS